MSLVYHMYCVYTICTPTCVVEEPREGAKEHSEAALKFVRPRCFPVQWCTNRFFLSCVLPEWRLEAGFAQPYLRIPVFALQILGFW